MRAYGFHLYYTTFAELLKGVSKMSDKTCAASDPASQWGQIDFRKAEACVKKLQNRISVAWKNDEFERAASLQHKLVHSFYAKALSVQIVSTNRGKDAPGIDNILWEEPEDKWNALVSMKSRGYSSMPLRRRYIPKPNGKLRPLSIPAMKDRAMQTLYKLALEPIAEVTGDLHSYGFRLGRSTRQAIGRCMEILSKPSSPQWILEADIQACFDNISHEWIMEHIPMDKKVLRKFLKCGYVDEGRFYATTAGVPQGGSISTVICNMVLDGLEPALDKAFPQQVQFVRYADDFIIAGADCDLLRNRVMPLVEAFMAERGLHLSPEKTVVTHIEDGFDFLGWNVRKVDGNLLVVPSLKNLAAFISKVQVLVRDNLYGSTKWWDEKLAPTVKGWINYHKGVVMPYALYEAEFDIVAYIWQTTQNKELTLFAGLLFATV